MATYRLRHFSEPETLKTIAPHRLVSFFQPHREFFSSQGLTLPSPRATGALDYEALITIFMAPDAKMPKDLIDALYFVDEMATPEGMDALLNETERQEIPLDPDTDPSPADVAVQVWLQDRTIIERKHAEQFLTKVRSYDTFQTDLWPVPLFREPTPGHLQTLETALDDTFEAKKRGRNARVFMFARPNCTWFMVRHGDPFRREESAEGKETSSVSFRPVKYDVLQYLAEVGELRVNARSRWEKDLYRKQMAKIFFGSEEVFQEAAKYTLEPLRQYGAASLNCVDVKGIETVRLKEAHFLWDAAHGAIEIQKAEDLFAAMQTRGWEMPQFIPLIRAVFSVKFRDAKSPRAVTIRLPRTAQYTRDGDSVYVEEWLRKRGFILGHSAQRPDAGDEILVDP